MANIPGWVTYTGAALLGVAAFLEAIQQPGWAQVAALLGAGLMGGGLRRAMSKAVGAIKNGEETSK